MRCTKCKSCKRMLFMLVLLTLWRPAVGFWDVGTTTPAPKRDDTVPRTSYFRWQRTEFTTIAFWFPHFDWHDIANRRALCVVAGISLDHMPLGTAAILNRRQLLTSGNYLDKVMDRQLSLRIWCLGRAGRHDTPFRYRVWRVHRIPRSNNPEHRHGARGYHCPRHDVAVIISYDQMYIYSYYPHRYQYAYQTWLTTARARLPDYVIMTGSGYEYLEHIYENYKIFYTKLPKSKVVDCSKYLPKWWGKFICVRNDLFLSGVQNGGPVLGVKSNILFALGCFEIRYNEDRIFVLTDLRYYTTWIYRYARMSGGDYYEFAYPEWGMQGGLFDWYDGHSNNPKIPHFHIHYDLFPLG